MLSFIRGIQQELSDTQTLEIRRSDVALTDMYISDIEVIEDTPEGIANRFDGIRFVDSELLDEANRRIEVLTNELNRVAPFLALHGVDGYTMTEVKDE